MKRIFILAGEPSGDIHAARLMQHLRHLDGDIEFEGIGGENMIKQGLQSLVPLDKMSVVGINEVLKQILFFKNVMTLCRNTLKKKKFDAFIPVDYPGFNLRLAKYAKQLNIPVLYYIAPQLWAWGKNRTKRMQNRIDMLMVVFPFEVDFFGKLGINTRFVGHPLLDDPEYDNEFLTFERRNDTITIMPGSRKHEIQKHSALVNDIIATLYNKLPYFRLNIAVTKAQDIPLYENLQKQYPELTISEQPKALMKTSKSGIIKTGTSNLEAALSGLPINMFYKTSSLSYHLGKHLVNLDYLSLINILAGQKIINEYIQHDAKADLIVNDIVDLVNNQERYSQIQSKYVEIREMLGKSGASKRAAQQILNFLQ